jgi:site-specific DNA-methyltransferase (adenine-specific)
MNTPITITRWFDGSADCRAYVRRFDIGNPHLMLLHGDCLDLLPTLEAGSIDMVLCDLPYGTTACKWDSVIPFEPLWREYKRVCKPNAALVFTASFPFSGALWASAPEWFKYSWAWVKNRPTGPQHAKNRPMSKHEDVLVFSFGKMGHVIQLGPKRMTYNPQGVYAAGVRVVTAKGSHSRLTGSRPNQVGREYEAMTGFPHSVLEFAKEESHVHPTQKPVALMEYLIRTYTNPGDTVLDNTMGSGTTGVACVNTGRQFIGIERDADYFAIAQRRIADAQSQERMAV